MKPQRDAWSYRKKGVGGNTPYFWLRGSCDGFECQVRFWSGSLKASSPKGSWRKLGCRAWRFGS